jgi:hypothetical protein
VTVDLDKLEQLARAAAEETKGGDWKRERDWVEATDSHAFVRPYPAAGRHILAANPAAVLELVQRLRTVEAKLAEKNAWIQVLCANPGGEAERLRRLTVTEAIVRDLANLDPPPIAELGCELCQHPERSEYELSCVYRRAVEAKP